MTQKAGSLGIEDTVVMTPTAQLQAFLQRHSAEIFEKDETTLTKAADRLDW